MGGPFQDWLGAAARSLGWLRICRPVVFLRTVLASPVCYALVFTGAVPLCFPFSADGGTANPEWEPNKDGVQYYVKGLPQFPPLAHSASGRDGSGY